MTIEVTERADLEVRLDETLLPRELWGELVPMSPGRHELSATAPGSKPWSSGPFRADADHALTIEVPRLETETSVAPRPSGEATSPTPPLPLKREQRWGVQRTTATAMAGAGAAAVTAGLVFLILGKLDYDESKANCGTTVCRPPGDDQRLRAIGEKRLAIVTLPLGGVLLLGGATLWFTAPSRGEHQGVTVALLPRVGSAEIGLTLRGGW